VHHIGWEKLECSRRGCSPGEFFVRGAPRVADIAVMVAVDEDIVLRGEGGIVTIITNNDQRGLGFLVFGGKVDLS
jgi:hypothetical protein